MFRSAHLEMAIRSTRNAIAHLLHGDIAAYEVSKAASRWHLSFVREGK